MNKLVNALIACGSISFCIASAAIAGPNDFFGSDPQGAGQLGSTMGNTPGLSSGQPGAGDYTDDEKRMQKKYRSNIKSARELITKGQDMMKAGEGKHDDKMFKKGKIMMEIGQRRLNELETNNPFPEALKTAKEVPADKATMDPDSTTYSSDQ